MVITSEQWRIGIFRLKWPRGARSPNGAGPHCREARPASRGCAPRLLRQPLPGPAQRRPPWRRWQLQPPRLVAFSLLILAGGVLGAGLYFGLNHDATFLGRSVPATGVTDAMRHARRLRSSDRERPPAPGSSSTARAENRDGLLIVFSWERPYRKVSRSSYSLMDLSAASGPSTGGGAQLHTAALRSIPHCGHRPKQSSLHRIISGTARIMYSRIVWAKVDNLAVIVGEIEVVGFRVDGADLRAGPWARERRSCAPGSRAAPAPGQGSDCRAARADLASEPSHCTVTLCMVRCAPRLICAAIQIGIHITHRVGEKLARKRQVDVDPMIFEVFYPDS